MVSVIIPLYNKEKTVARALRSVLGQTSQKFDIIVVNDGSTDGSVAEVQRFGDPRIRLIHQSNAGVSAARNRGIAEAKFHWVAFLDADDEWKPRFLETIEQLSGHFPYCALYATGYEYVNERGESRPLLLRGLPAGFSRGIIHNYFEIAARSEPLVCSSAVAIRTNALHEIGGFPLGIKSGEDLLTWARIASRYSIAYDRQSLSRFYYPESTRVRPPRASLERDVVGEELLRLKREIPQTQQGSYRSYIGLWFLMRASVFLESGYGRQALSNAIWALQQGRAELKTLAFIVLACIPWPLRQVLYTRLRAYRRSS